MSYIRPSTRSPLDPGALCEPIYRAVCCVSHTSRGCIGRNLGMMELFIIIASIFRRYHFVLEDPKQEVRCPFVIVIIEVISGFQRLDIKEGFLRKPVACRAGIQLRCSST